MSTLRALANLSSIGAAGLTVVNNTALPTCEADWLVSNVGAGLAGSMNISGNDAAGTCP